MSENDKRLIEDYLPIQAISVEASREKSVRKGHISTLHLWWARRPLVACRAAVYGALVPASRFRPESGPEEKRASLARANAAKFVERLCKYPGVPAVVAEAQRHILEAHAERLTQETRKPVTVEDIVTGRAPRPKVLDMFAGGGAIPLEALRLGCEAYALDLNPVARIIELCTLVYPQKYGGPNASTRGMTGPSNTAGETTWGGLAKEVRYWGKWVLGKVKTEIGDVYPLIPDPRFQGSREIQADWLKVRDTDDIPPAFLKPIAYLWTRTVRCKNPACGGTVPLFKQTWLNQKKPPFAALEPVVDKARKVVRFRLQKSNSLTGFDFDPHGGSYRGNTVCPFCGSAVENTYVMDQGMAGQIGRALMCVIARSANDRERRYIGTDDTKYDLVTAAIGTEDLAKRVSAETRGVLDAEIPFDKRESFWCRRYGLLKFSQAFTPRQQVFLGACAKTIEELARANSYDRRELVEAVQANLACWLDKLADYNSSLCHWDTSTQSVRNTLARQALPMVWDFAELNPFAGLIGDAEAQLVAICEVIDACSESGQPAQVLRGSATELPFADSHFDCIVTDPPYYDNISYAKLADFFYVWMRCTLGQTSPEHFASSGTPKKKEAVVDVARSDGDKESARREYESLMLAAFREAYRVLKAGGFMVCIYAHRTTLGWSTLVDGLRKAGFAIAEAWPLDTEMKTRIRAVDNASLASSIFLVARKRDAEGCGRYEEEVQPELEAIVRERVPALWDLGISGADLVIACVGAGLRAFTRFARVEFANGEEVPAERFLTEVETVVLETILDRLSREAGGAGRANLVGVDPATRCYVLWRYTYRMGELEAGEAIIFANGTHVELDGPGGLSSGPRPLVEKKKGKYRLRDYAERGEDEKLGLPRENGEPAPLVDTLHRTLWLMERRPGKLSEFLQEAQPNREQMRLVAQALAGPALKGGELSDVSPSGELGALAKLMANWRSVVEEAVMTPAERDERRTGQKPLDFGKEGRR